jgi:MFS family permease
MRDTAMRDAKWGAMRRLARLLLITFIESFATVCIERGVYFYSTDILKFSDAANLWLALVFGAAYVVGALSSHAFSLRMREKPLLLASLGGQWVVHVTLGVWAGATLPGLNAAVFVGNMLLGFLNGIKWPVIESYVSAGWTPTQAARAVGIFNVSWAMAVPMALGVTGWIVAHVPAELFLLPAMLNGICIGLSLPLPVRPVHLPPDHPERPSPGMLRRLRSVLAASRWMMLSSYSLLWILAALMPRILHEVGFGVESAAGVSGLVDVMRTTSFVIFWLWAGWHGRIGFLAAALVVLPAGFFMILFGGVAPVVLAGEVLFGLAAGLIYYSALYHAMVVTNAAVEAGGAHEGLIGLGFAVGPAAGLIGVAMGPVLGDQVLGTLTGVGPVVVLCAVGAIWQMVKAGRRIDT